MSTIQKLRYCQVEGIPPFDWYAVLKDAEDVGLDNWGWDDLRLKSDSWTTCAVGNMCAIIPRLDGGQPKDETLSDLGISFHEAIKEREPARALRILNQIEKRSKLLIKEILKSQKS